MVNNSHAILEMFQKGRRKRKRKSAGYSFCDSMKRIPSIEDINRYGMPDEEYAVQHFYGKNEEEAAELFFLNAEYYGGDFL